MSRIDVRVQVVDTAGGRTFVERFDVTPIRIGRAVGNDLFLPHPAIAAHHGEIAIGARSARFRSRAWLRASRIDGVRVKRGRSVKVTEDSVISLGPFEVSVWFRVRDRRTERDRKVTPLMAPVSSDMPALWPPDRLFSPPPAQRGEGQGDGSGPTPARRLSQGLPFP